MPVNRFLFTIYHHELKVHIDLQTVLIISLFESNTKEQLNDKKDISTTKHWMMKNEHIVVFFSQHAKKGWPV